MKSKKTRESHIALHREDNELMEPGRTSNIHQNELIAKLSSTKQKRNNLKSITAEDT
jgi:hypothetical protein